MGEIVQLDAARARRDGARGAERAAAPRAPARPGAFEAVECGSGWYHGEAIRASQEPCPRPH